MPQDFVDSLIYPIVTVLPGKLFRLCMPYAIYACKCAIVVVCEREREYVHALPMDTKINIRLTADYTNYTHDVRFRCGGSTTISGK